MLAPKMPIDLLLYILNDRANFPISFSITINKITFKTSNRTDDLRNLVNWTILPSEAPLWCSGCARELGRGPRWTIFDHSDNYRFVDCIIIILFMFNMMITIFAILSDPISPNLGTCHPAPADEGSGAACCACAFQRALRGTVQQKGTQLAKCTKGHRAKLVGGRAEEWAAGRVEECTKERGEAGLQRREQVRAQKRRCRSPALAGKRCFASSPPLWRHQLGAGAKQVPPPALTSAAGLAQRSWLLCTLSESFLEKHAMGGASHHFPSLAVTFPIWQQRRVLLGTARSCSWAAFGPGGLCASGLNKASWAPLKLGTLMKGWARRSFLVVNLPAITAGSRDEVSKETSWRFQMSLLAWWWWGHCNRGKPIMPLFHQ